MNTEIIEACKIHIRNEEIKKNPYYKIGEDIKIHKVQKIKNLSVTDSYYFDYSVQYISNLDPTFNKWYTSKTEIHLENIKDEIRDVKIHNILKK
jgi:hypothetical protein